MSVIKESFFEASFKTIEEFDSAAVAAASPESIKEILVAAGSRYQMHDPTSWPLQAGLAAEGKMEELAKWQDEHKGGKM